MNKYSILKLAIPFVSFLASMAMLLVIVVLIGESPGNAVEAIWKMTFSRTSRVANILSTAIPLYLAGIAVAFGFRAGVFNIGVEGQYFIGGFTGALAGIYLNLPAWIHVPVVVLCAMLGGAMWSFVPAIMKATKGIHEVITTIMFNNIALILVNYLVNGPFSGLVGTTSLEAQTKPIRSTAMFHKLNPVFRAIGWNVPDNVYLDYSLIIAAIAGIVVWFLLFRLRVGFDIRAVGTSLNVSMYTGIRVKKIQIGVILASGALAGLIGLQEIFAIRGVYTYALASGLGLNGIAVSLLGGNSPVGIVFSALLFAFLKQAGYGLQLYTLVPNSVIDVVTGLMIIIIVVSNELMGGYIRNKLKREAA